MSGLDEKARQLYREAETDPAAARRWARHLERLEKGERVLLDSPLSKAEIGKLRSENNGIIEGLVTISVATVIGMIRDTPHLMPFILDALATRLVGWPVLGSVEFRVIDVVDENVFLVRVCGEMLDEDFESLGGSA